MFRRLSLILKIMGKLFEYPEAKSVVVCGDIHGDFHTLANKMCKQYQMTDTLLIVAGDCGFGNFVVKALPHFRIECHPGFELLMVLIPPVGID